MASPANLAIVITARDQASQAMRSISKEARAINAVMGAIGTGVGMAAGFVGFQGLTASLNAAKDAAIGFNSRMEQGAVGWGATLKNEILGVTMTADILKTSLQKGLDFAQMTKNTRYLVNMGVAASEVKDAYLDIANVAAGTGLGSEAIDRITWALGQMQAKGVVSAEEMTQQLGELIPAWQILADHIGKTVAETQKMAEQREISPDTMLEAFRAFSKENFGDMLEKQARTWQGAMQIIGSAGQYITGVSFKPIFDELSALAVKAAEFARSDQFAEWGARSQRAIASIITDMKGIPNVLKDWEAAFGTTARGIIEQLTGLALFISAGALIQSLPMALAAFQAFMMALVTSARVGKVLVIAEFVALVGIALELMNDFNLRLKEMGFQPGGIMGEMRTDRSLQGLFEEIGKEALKAAGETMTFDNIMGSLADNIPSVANAMEAFNQPLEQTALDLAALPGPTEAASAALGEFGNKAKETADAARGLISSNANIIDYMVRMHPASIAAAAAVATLKAEIASVQSAIQANNDAIHAAQNALSAMQERVSQLSESLSKAKSRLQDLSNVRLTGMGQMDDQMFQIEQQIKRLKLQELGQDSSMFAPLTAEARAFVATLPGGIKELEKLLEIMRLQKSLKFDEQLKAIKEAAEGKPIEMGFAEALKQIADTKGEISGLEVALAGAQAAVKAQQQAIKGLQEAGYELGKALQNLQTQLQGAEEKQRAVNDVLKIAAEWEMEHRDKLIELGGEYAIQAGLIDEMTRKLVADMSQYVQDETEAAVRAIRALYQEYEDTRAKMAAGGGGAPPPPPPSAGGSSSGGSSGGQSQSVTVQVYVQGSVVTERKLVEAVREGLLKKGRQNINVGLA